MVVRRIREHVATHNWFAVAVDVGIVVLGVFLGTQVSNWNDDRLEARDARDHRRRLLQELDFNVRQYAAQVRYYEQVLDHGKSAVAALDERGAPPGDFIVDAYQLSQIDQSPAKTYVYQEMVSAGFVSGIGDERLQNLASDYYLNVAIGNPMLDRTLPYRDLIRGLVPLGMQAQIESACGDQSVMYEGRLVGLKLAEDCRLGFAGPEVGLVTQAIRGAPDIRVLMTRYVGTVIEKLDVLRFNHSETEKLITALEQDDRHS